MAHPLSNTNPAELRRRLEASGPIGFIMAVYLVLKKLGRPYFYSAAVPEWLTAGGSIPAEAYAAAYGAALDPKTAEKPFVQIPHCIVHQYRQYPAKRRYAGTSDSPDGARRQKTPLSATLHERPLPESPSEDYYDAEEPTGMLMPAFRGRGAPPLWDSIDDVPDLIRDHITKDTECVVTQWEYDVFVDFVLLAANEHLLEQMHKDLMTILRFFHDRSQTGASNLTGWFHSSQSGAPAPIGDALPKGIPARTITWRLKQIEAYAFPVRQLESIQIDLFGERRTL